MAHSRLDVQGQLRRLDKLHFLPEWRQGVAELESGCWYGAGMRVELTPEQARRRSKAEDRDSVYATRAEIEFLCLRSRAVVEGLDVSNDSEVSEESHPDSA